MQNLDSNALILKYGKLVSGICRRMLQNEALAEEAAQEAWIKILDNLDSFKGDAKLSTWIYSIVKRYVFYYGKKEKRLSVEKLEDIFNSKERVLPVYNFNEQKIWVKEKCDNCITGMLHCLTNKSRLIYIFRNIACLSYSEIAQIMETQEAALRKSVSRSSQKLNLFMSKNCPLFRPLNNCKCRSKTVIRQVNLANEYGSIRNILKAVSFFKKSEQTLPRKNYWEKFLKKEVTKL